jgi:hypothetical protein
VGVLAKATFARDRVILPSVPRTHEKAVYNFSLAERATHVGTAAVDRAIAAAAMAENNTAPVQVAILKAAVWKFVQRGRESPM